MNSRVTVQAGDRRSSAASPVRSDHVAATEAALAERYPDVPRALVHALVLDAYRSFADARIRDFLPLLVWRIVRDRLAAVRQDSEGA